MRKFFFLAAVLVALLAGTAAKPALSTPSWNPASRWLQTCNDEEGVFVGTCVTDPLQCAWGDEDDVADTAYGKLSSGVTTSDTLCLVTDTCSDFACPHYLDAFVTGNGLRVTLTSDQGDSYTVPYVQSAREYQLCISDPHFSGDRNPLDYPLLPLPFVLGSYGVLTHWTLTVTATKTTQFSGGLEIAQNHADGSFLYYHQFSEVPCVWS